MKLFSLRDWLFSLETFGAAGLALYISLAMDLPRPYWAAATVYICSQPLSGATRSKAVYRVCGTLLGAIVSIAFVPNLVASPELLSFAISSWVAFCLFVSLLDRGPRSYVFILAGYTTALIGFPIVDAPEAIFDTAVARLEEIIVGIVCASVVSSVVFPSNVALVVAERLGTWLADADFWSSEVLVGCDQRRTSHAHRLRLASDASSLDNLSILLAFDTSNQRHAARALRMLRLRMLMLLPVLESLSDMMGELARDGTPLLPTVQALLDDIRRALVQGRDVSRTTMDALHRIVTDRDPSFAPCATARDHLLASLLVRLEELINIRQDCRHLHDQISNGRTTKFVISYKPEAGIADVRHRDFGFAALSALAAFVCVGGVCWIWIATSWPEGGTAAMIAAVACCLFASQDDPVPTLRSFANWSALAAVNAVVYLFVILPRIQDFEILILAFAPTYIFFGLLATKRTTAVASIALSLWTATLMALQETYRADFAGVLNSGLALLTGIWYSALVFRLVRSTGAAWRINRLVQANRLTLAEAAEHRGRRDRAQFAALLLDRLGLLATLLATSESAGHDPGADPLTELRIGLAIIELRHARHDLPQSVVEKLDAMLAAMSRHFRTAPSVTDPALLPLIDDASRAVAAARPGKAKQNALLGLVEIRCMIFGGASPPKPTADPALAEATAA